MPKDPTFTDYADWKRKHLKLCPHAFRDDQRSTVSRVIMCGWSLVSRRCMFRWCPLMKPRED